MRRVNDILLGPLERPALAWLCRHMPSWVTPDTLTLVGIIGGVATLIGYWLANVSPHFLWLACAGLVANWFGDSLDGSLARHRSIERPKYGYFVDHMTDAFVTAMICVGLGLSPYVGMVYALCGLVGYLLMSILTYVTGQVTNVFQISYGKFGPTEIRVILIMVSTIFYVSPNPLLHLGPTPIHLFDLVVLGIAAALTLACVGSTIVTSRRLAVQEPPPQS
jgi:archaetidylinositol phosphate synthase